MMPFYIHIKVRLLEKHYPGHIPLMEGVEEDSYARALINPNKLKPDYDINFFVGLAKCLQDMQLKSATLYGVLFIAILKGLS